MALPAELPIRENVPLAPRTTLELGGPARFFLTAEDDRTVAAGLRWARAKGVPAYLLGGGSNLVVSDAGVDGLVIGLAQRGVRRGPGGSWAVAAGEPWDDLVAATVTAGHAGLECLSGIPGLVGATPIQNVGAYGQQVEETVVEVRALDRTTLEEVRLDARACAFAYRDSRFKREPGRFAVLGVTFRLAPGGAPTVRYAELEGALEGRAVDLRTVRDTVLALRARKSMVIAPADPNRRSAGSFFTNPIVPAEEAERLVHRAVQEGLVRDAGDVPRWPADGGTKLAAGWLIERAGLGRGTRRGAVGSSSKHALALVHHGGGTTEQLLSFAAEARRAVADRFGVALTMEPVTWGVRPPWVEPGAPALAAGPSAGCS